MSLSQPKTKANTCIFCGDAHKVPAKCSYCGFKFCDEHIKTENHQCGKTRYAEYVRKTDADTIPNLASGQFFVVCDMCGYRSSSGSLIEFAGEELVQHMQIVGCSGHTYLEEVGKSPQFHPQSIPVKKEDPIATPVPSPPSKDNIVDQLAKLAVLKDTGTLSDEEFLFIKKEILKQLR
ncbi:SHOCT domain-containing protein [Candidatus Nitrosotenuis aquarius]|uniref:SHOCT domain-containing protein n=1 Tax=Candidatus Nitrosotenuis aquarius TaxID=1846278 RepID=UPI0013C2A05A|nr:hypothetical protein [Candidatus Nitrosotenuis aquarius]